PVAGVVAVLLVRLALGHVIPPVTAAYLSPPPLRASLAMIQPAAKATPNEAIGRSRIKSAALSTRSWPLTISWSTCSRAAPAPSSIAAMPDSALSARSALTCALPRRASSPATLAALRNASPAWLAACLMWSLASPRLLLRLSVWVGFIVWTPVVGRTGRRLMADWGWLGCAGWGCEAEERGGGRGN